jgi:uncharacterized protein (TIGR03435 family)
MIGVAWGLPMRLIKGEPNWPDGTDRFSVNTKAEEPVKTTQAQLLDMLQALLIDRFQLKFHREKVEQPGFALVVGKKGPKMKPAKAGAGGVQRNFSRRAKPSREGEQIAFPGAWR